jgi:hypothetical protein
MTDTTEEPRYTLTRQNGVLTITDRQDGLTLTEENDGDVFRDYLGILFGGRVELALAMEVTP